jgi:tetratricopeptide (TPR) repeat protein
MLFREAVNNMLSTITQLREAARHDRKNASAANELGEAYYLRLEYTSAERYFRKAAALQPDNVKYLTNLAIVLRQLGKTHRAEATFRRALQFEPNSYGLNVAMGQLYLDQLNDTVKAAEYYRKAVFLSPDESNSLINTYSGLCSCYIQNDTFRQSLVQIEREVGLNKNMLKILQGFARALYGRGRYEEMRDCVQQLLRIEPSDAIGLALMARVAKDQRDYATALHYHQEALRLCPSHLATIIPYLRYMQLLGDYDAASRYYRGLAKRSLFFKYDKPEWDGSSLVGKTIMLVSRFGLGDAIQGARFATLLKQQGATVLFLTHKRLCSLIRTVDGAKHTLALHEECPPYDYICNTMSIWFLMGVDFEAFGRPVPYLNPPVRLREESKTKVNTSRLKVGLCWQSSQSLLHSNPYTCRSMPFSHLRQLADVSGVTYFSLQMGSNAATLDFPMIDFTAVRDFMDTAAIIAELDLVISVDTSIAHLAGALGKRTFLLIPYSPDWQWLLNREDSPWYPTMRLFRQPTPGGWSQVIQQVKQALQELVQLGSNA